MHVKKALVIALQDSHHKSYLRKLTMYRAGRALLVLLLATSLLYVAYHRLFHPQSLQEHEPLSSDAMIVESSKKPSPQDIVRHI